ncbi:hypothetical protein [Cohnella fermenti]|uniref:DUF2140 family protein n=1 Tax=Cohnella fermenti TaxID=2565925 RepID=A0A4S4BSH4_9BACL|nr:hypothetical protein [Cohnella fermenti]THF78001.1 hypothetical protein E6C55_14950 [Cohnella fermenti]
MRKWWIALFVLILVVVGIVIVAYRYAAPQQELDLRYEDVPLRDRAIDMAKRLSTTLVLSEEDVNNLAKAQLAENPIRMKDAELTGVQFRLGDGALIADVNVEAMGRIPIGMTLTYDVEWVSPNLIARVSDARIRGIHLPADSFAEVTIPLGSELPDWLKIKEVRIEAGQAAIEFQKPSLSDLKSLLD